MTTVDILSVKVDKISLAEALRVVDEWIGEKGKHYIVTPNIEFLMRSLEDKSFKQVLNKADLKIPDSSRFNWVLKMLSEQNIAKRIIYWPLFLTPGVKILPKFPVTTGVDLMEGLIKVSEEKGYTIGFLGGKQNLAKRLAERLKHKYSKLNVIFTDSSMIVNEDGETVATSYQLPATDLVFVAFGAPKQEKWIAKNLQRLDVKVMMGVGGAFEYLSGDIPRAPYLVRGLGFEWLFRLIIQPWRIKRFLSLLRFIFMVLGVRKI